MTGFKRRFTQIKGLSETRRLPRLGIIRLGIKVEKSSGSSYPKETDYFVCPDEVKEVYGNQPKSLEVMLPVGDIDAVFPQAYCHYGSSKGLKCQGDGEVALEVNPETGDMEERECPCDLLENGKCKQTGTLNVILPKVSVGGVYQIRTSSFNSIVDINSGIDYVKALLDGHVAMVPLMLDRVMTETHHENKKQKHYTLRLTFPGNLDVVNALRQNQRMVLSHQLELPPPVSTNPEFDDADIKDLEDEEDQELRNFLDNVNTFIEPLGKPVIIRILMAKYHCNQLENLPENERKDFIRDLNVEVDKQNQ